MSIQNPICSTHYISQMSEDDKILFIRILIALSHIDKELQKSEKTFIRNMATMFRIPEEKTPSIDTSPSVEEIIKEAASIKNRNIALHIIKEICFLANSDGNLSNEEMLFIGQVGQAMGIELEKIAQISQWIIDYLVWIENSKIIFEEN